MMHCRFIKRSIASAIILTFAGFVFVSRWSRFDLRINSISLLEEDNQPPWKAKRFTTGDSHEKEVSKREFNYDNDSWLHFTSSSWIQSILDKNLPGDETVEELNKDVGMDVAEFGNFQESSPTEEVRSQVRGPSTTIPSHSTITRRPIVTKFPRRKRRKRKRPSAVYAGFLNVHIWRAWCGSTIEDLRRNKHFPLYPDRRTTVDDFFDRHSEVSYGERLFGFIHPPKSGNFTFYVSSDDNSELWLSNSSNPANARKIAWVGNRTSTVRAAVADFNVAEGQKSQAIYLRKSKMYFIEALHKQRAFSNHILVAWKGPGMKKAKRIGSAYISAYLDEYELSSDVNVLAEYIPETKASYPTHHHGTVDVNPQLLKDPSNFGSHDDRDHFHLIPSIEGAETEGVLPKCRYKPSYLVDFEVNRYEGVYLIHETAVYPDDKTELTHMIPLTECDLRSSDSHGNSISQARNRQSFNEPATPTEDTQHESPGGQGGPDSDGDDPRGGNNRTVTMGSNFNALITKLKKRFKDFHTFMRSNGRIFGDKQAGVGKAASKMNVDRNEILRGREEGGVKGGKKRENKDRVAAESNSESKAVDDLKGSANSDRTEKASSDGRINNKNVKKLSRMHSKNFKKKPREKSAKYPENRDGNFSEDMKGKKLTNTQKRGGKVYKSRRDHVSLRRSKHGSGELRGGIYQGSKNKIVNNKAKYIYRKDYLPRTVENIPVKEKIAFKASKMNEHKSTVKGRKLLSSQDRQVVFAYETDDEGLPSSWNKYERSKPIFVPIEGVENENKPLENFASNVAKKTKSENGDREAVTEIDGSDSQETFQMKSAYKRLNITSNRDVLKNFKIFKYAFYDMINEEPRLLSWIYHHDRTECKSDGNLRLNEKVAISIVSKYMRALKKRHGDKYTLKKIINVEENHDVIKGDRYLIELDLKMKGQGDRSFRLSRYVYQKVGDTNLCEPIGFQWNRHTTVHVIVPVKNQGRWVQHFIDNMEQIYLETLDSHLNVIIVDFNSTDIDIEKSLRNSKLKRYKLIKLNGPFQRALGIQAGADAVDNPHDIIFTCDLHLEIPSALIDNIRKHCVEGSMAFAPIVVRLDCGYLPDNPYGLWELQGYGLFAICKSDFDKAGGMNTKEFKTKWGGEDWEMLDRILSNKLEVERLRVPKFYHYYHSKKGMWSKT